MGFKRGEQIVARLSLEQAVNVGYANKDGTLVEGAERDCVRSRLWRGVKIDDPITYEYLVKR